MTQRNRWQRAAAMALAAAAVAACAGGPDATAPDGPLFNTTQSTGHGARVCKVGSAATFEVSVNGGPVTTHALAAGECKQVFTWTPGLYTVRITELAAPGVTLDSIVRDSNEVRTGVAVRLAPQVGTNTAFITVHELVYGTATFYNTPDAPPPPPPPPPPPAHGATVCKVGSAATFGVSVNGGPSMPLALADGECRMVFTWTPGLYNVTVTEQVPAGYQLDSIVRESLEVRTGIVTRLSAVTGTTSGTMLVHELVGGTLTFFNAPVPPPPPPPPPPPGGGEGCTPGYWKQPHHFDSWPAQYQPNMQFSAVFENAFPGMTLLQVLSQGGGGLKALGRHTVAALLNGGSSGVSYDLNAQGVIDAFNAVFPGGDYNGLHNRLAAFNEQGCPLN